jgi:hypothetical protein
MSELVSLACKSRPRADMLNNCSSGVVEMESLETIVGAATKVDTQGMKSAELVFMHKDEWVEGLDHGKHRLVSGGKYR